MLCKNDLKHFGQILAAHSIIEIFKISLGVVLLSAMTSVAAFFWNVMQGTARPEAINAAVSTFTAFLIFLLAVWGIAFVAVRTWVSLAHPKQVQLPHEAVPANRSDNLPRLERHGDINDPGFSDLPPGMTHGVTNLPPGMRSLSQELPAAKKRLGMRSLSPTLSSPPTSAEAAKIATEADIRGFKFSVGRWRLGSLGGDFIAELCGDGTARRHAFANSPAQDGTWGYINGQVCILWNDGWVDVIRCTHNLFIKVAFAPGSFKEETPAGVAQAIALDR